MTRIVETKRLLAASAVIAALSMTFAGVARAAPIIEIDPGFNLFQTTPVSSISSTYRQARTQSTRSPTLIGTR